MALADELTALVARAGRGVLDDATSFGAALDDYVSPEAASRGVLNLLVDAVRQGALDRLLRDIEHGADPARAIAASGDQLARDRAAGESASSRWAVALLGYAAGAVDGAALAAFPPPTVASPPPTGSTPAPRPPAPRPPAPPPTAPPHQVPLPPTLPRPEPASRRRGPVLVGVVAVVLLVVGGVLAVVLLQGRDGDDGARDGTTTSPGTGDAGSARHDPAAFEATLREVAASVLDDPADDNLSVRSWSTEQDNLTDGYPRLLEGVDRAAATEWYLEDATSGVTTSHLPPDARDHYVAATCAGLSDCEEFTTADGRHGVDYWQEGGGGADYLHQVVVDSGDDNHLVTVYELVDSGTGRGLAKAKQQARISAGTLRTVAGDPRLLFPLPDPAPGLPSFPACSSSAGEQPAGCPAWITPLGS